MRKQKPIVFIFSSILVLLFFISPVLIAQHHTSIAIMSNGGEKQSSTNYILVGSVGQVGVDLITNPNHHIQSGFWNAYYQDVIVDVEEQEVLPVQYKLEQNYPNPFNPSTIIRFAVPERSTVVLKIYDVLGSEIQTLVNEEMERGWYEKIFNASGYASGMYICTMHAGDYISTKKMLLVK
jgi:hypothetical protein